MTLLIVGAICLAPMLILFIIATSLDRYNPRRAAVFGWSSVATFAVVLILMGIGLGLYVSGSNARTDSIRAQVEKQYHISLTDDQTQQLADKQLVKLNDGSSVQLVFDGDTRAELRKITYTELN